MGGGVLPATLHPYSPPPAPLNPSAFTEAPLLLCCGKPDTPGDLASLAAGVGDLPGAIKRGREESRSLKTNNLSKGCVWGRGGCRDDAAAVGAQEADGAGVAAAAGGVGGAGRRARRSCRAGAARGAAGGCRATARR
jgi:hypothetical protein